MKHYSFFVALILLVACKSDNTVTSTKVDKPVQTAATNTNEISSSNNKSPEVKNIVFVCSRGIDKSVIAAHYFNEVVVEKRLHYKAMSRASINDKYSTNNIPTAVLTEILSTGLSLHNTNVLSLEENAIDAAYKIIYLDDPPVKIGDEKKMMHWDGIPPIKAGVHKTTDIIKEKVDQFVKTIGC